MVGGLAAAAVLPLLAACGGDDDEPTATTAPAAQPTATDAPVDATATMAQPASTATEAAADPTATSASQPTTTTQLPAKPLVIYCGRSEALVGPLMEQFTADTGIEVEVRYAGTTELAAQLLEEGDNSPADVYFAQDAGALGAIAKAGMFAPLAEATLTRVEPRFRSSTGSWVGLSGRARVVVYNKDLMSEADIPDTILDFVDPKWKGLLGWAPTNASFQSFITALRVERGEDTARTWLEGLIANETRSYEGNDPIRQAVAAGEIHAGFINHYYLLRAEAETGVDSPAENFIYTNGDPGALVNVAGIGILASSGNQQAAAELVTYLLSEPAQVYFAEQTWEYPLAAGVPAAENLIPLDEIKTPLVDLSDLDDLAGTLELLTDVGLI
ncbi:MAG: iron ABC transporter substrate-binding protein [Chloroflexi bacterium]|nr:MAG: iron ABC transporter substrate-binding protein [Chloroflexota bacterium]